MRLIGHLNNETNAKTLGDYLLSLEIRNSVEPDAGSWAVWVYSEDQVDAARRAMEDFVKNPADSKFQQARQAAAAIQERDRREQTDYNRRHRTAGQLWTSGGMGPVTLTLMVLSIAVTLFQFLPATAPMVRFLYMSERYGFLREVRAGQIWRLVTPIFIHFGLPHILFNMYVLHDFGSLVESRRGSRRFFWLVIILAIGSNLGQYVYAGPDFGGMSGVLYGLLGYIWIRSQCDPGSGLFMPGSTLVIMLVWFFLCVFGIIPNVANICHAAGLVLGILIGATPLVRRLFS